MNSFLDGAWTSTLGTVTFSGTNAHLQMKGFVGGQTYNGTLNGSSLSVTDSAIGATFTAALSSKGNLISGVLKTKNQSENIDFSRAAPTVASIAGTVNGQTQTEDSNTLPINDANVVAIPQVNGTTM